MMAGISLVAFCLVGAWISSHSARSVALAVAFSGSQFVIIFAESTSSSAGYPIELYGLRRWLLF